jgi:hypothetical protein
MYHFLELLRRYMSVVNFLGLCITHITIVLLGEEMFG